MTTSISPSLVELETPRPGRPARKRRRRTWRTGGWAPYLFLAPFAVSFLAFFLVPSVFSLALSFTRYSGFGTATFVGLQNYLSLFQSPVFRESVLNTLFYWLVPLVPLIGGAFFLALLVRSRTMRMGRIYKPLLFIPQVMAPVAAGIVWRVILSNNGAFNSLFGIDVSWLNDPAAMRWGVVMLLVWRGIGWYFVVFLAGLTSISPELLEAAEVDGATAWQKIRYVILPLMKPIFLFAIVIDTIASLQLYTEPNLLLAGSPSGAPPAAAPIMNQVVNNITGGQFGLAAAVGWLMFIAIGIFSLIQFRMFREGRS